MGSVRDAFVIGAAAVILAGACGNDEPALETVTVGTLLVDASATIVVTDEPPVLVIVTDEAASPTTTVAPSTTTTAAPTTTTTAPPAPVPASSGVPLVIFETDMGPDIDDALGLAMLHAYAKLGEIELAAITISRDSEAAARYTDALNTFYGRPDIPIGINRNSSANYFDDRQNFVRLADTMTYDLPSESIEDGYKLQRRVLADAVANGRQVLLIQTGFSGNVSRLLDSSGDSISPLSGMELTRRAVSELSIMAGAIEMDVVEFNIENDLGPARNLFAKWPGRLALSPFELGYNLHYPYSSIKSELSWNGNHPIRKAYEAEDLGWHQDAPPFYNMRSWDLTSIMHAIEPDRNYFSTSGRGTVSVASDGRTSFQAGSGRHYVLDRGRRYSYEERQRAINRMIELVSMQP